MATKTTYMNNFAISMQNLTVILDGKSTAPNIENTNYGAPVFDQRKVVDENFVYMPIEIAKELALSILHIVGTTEKRSGFKVNLPPEKQQEWEEAVNALDALRIRKEAEKAAEEDE